MTSKANNNLHKYKCIGFSYHVTSSDQHFFTTQISLQTKEFEHMN